MLCYVHQVLEHTFAIVVFPIGHKSNKMVKIYSYCSQILGTFEIQFKYELKIAQGNMRMALCLALKPFLFPMGPAQLELNFFKTM